MAQIFYYDKYLGVLKNFEFYDPKNIQRNLQKKNLYIYDGRKQNLKKSSQNTFCENFQVKKNVFFSYYGREVIIFHLIPYLLKSVEKFLKNLTLGNFSGPVAAFFFAIEQKTIECTSKGVTDP